MNQTEKQSCPPICKISAPACRSIIASVVVIVACCCRGHALAPHQVALLFNSRSETSALLAREYAEGRGIPGRNMISLAVDERFLEPAAEMTAAEFTRIIWEPSRQYLTEHELDGQILAWIYSVDFPLRIKGDPPLSLTGLTFLRNRWPDGDAVRDGRYASPLYGGPEPGDGSIAPPMSLDRQLEMVGADGMPLPAAMLGYTGRGGNSLSTVRQMLRNGLAADATQPRGTVYFVITPGIRSQVRQWQFDAAVEELARYGVRAETVRALPAAREDVLGLLAGETDPDPQSIGTFLPGAFAEHLTSFSAVYEIRQHTKMTDWTDAGASASAGVVTEPRAYWTKFPTARFFVYYAAGTTLLESFYQSVRSPVQSVLIGDPLMRPFAASHTVVLESFPADGRGLIRAAVSAPQPEQYDSHEFWINDRLVKRGAGSMRLDLDGIALLSGKNRLRVVARRSGFVSHTLWAETEFYLPEKAGR